MNAKRMSYLVIVLVSSQISSYAQILHPVKWSYAAKKTSATEATIFIKAVIDEGWHIYSVNQADGGPIKTTFTFLSSKDFSLLGKNNEPKPTEKFEKTFNMEVLYFSKTVVFQQKIKLNSSKSMSVKGSLNFMVCNDEKCLPPEDVEFSIPVK